MPFGSTAVIAVLVHAFAAGETVGLAVGDASVIVGLADVGVGFELSLEHPAKAATAIPADDTKTRVLVVFD